MKKIIFFLFVIPLSFSGCSKDDDDKNCDLNSTNIVGTYKVTAATYKATPGSAEEDEFINWDDCEKDDLIIFNDNGNVNNQDAGIKCNPPGDDTFTWALTGNVLTLNGLLAATVSSFDCSTLKISITDPSGGVAVTTFARQ